MGDDECEGGFLDWRGSWCDATIDGATLDELLHLLADERRRVVLRHVLERDGDVVGYDDLVADVVADLPAAEDAEAERIELHHDTLPRISEAGLIDVDPRSETIRVRGEGELGTLLGFLSEIEDREGE